MVGICMGLLYWTFWELSMHMEVFPEVFGGSSLDLKLAVSLVGTLFAVCATGPHFGVANLFILPHLPTLLWYSWHILVVPKTFPLSFNMWFPGVHILVIHTFIFFIIKTYMESTSLDCCITPSLSTSSSLLDRGTQWSRQKNHNYYYYHSSSLSLPSPPPPPRKK